MMDLQEPAAAHRSERSSNGKLVLHVKLPQNRRKPRSETFRRNGRLESHNVGDHQHRNVVVILLVFGHLKDMPRLVVD